MNITYNTVGGLVRRRIARCQRGADRQLCRAAEARADGRCTGARGTARTVRSVSTARLFARVPRLAIAAFRQSGLSIPEACRRYWLALCVRAFSGRRGHFRIATVDSHQRRRGHWDCSRCVFWGRHRSAAADQNSATGNKAGLQSFILGKTAGMIRAMSI